MKKIRRKKYLVNRRVQLGHAGNMVLLILLVAVITTGIVAWVCLFAMNQRLTCQMDHGFFIKAGIIIAFMAAGAVIWAVRHTHAIAGPVYKTGQILREAAAGRIPDAPVVFRRNDAFKDLAADLNRVLAVMRQDRSLGGELAALEKIIRSPGLAAEDRLARIESLLATASKRNP